MRAAMTTRAFMLGLLLPIAAAGQDTTAIKASLLHADRTAASSEASLRQAMAPGAAVLIPGEDVLRGEAAWSGRLTTLVAPAEGRAAWTPLHAVVSRDGGFGCTTGVLHLASADSTRPTTGRYAACWQREGDGRWRMLALSRAPAPPSVKSLPDSLPGAPGSTGAAAPRGARPAFEMTEADRLFGRFSADSGGPAGAFARWVADDGMMLGARAAPARGPAQVGQAFAAFPATGHFAWAPIEALTQSSADGSLGLTIGEARIAATPAQVTYSKYLTIWRRERDGRYRWVFDIGSDRPASPDKPAPSTR
jgi:ketosteroid isomerase-like protein